MKHYEPGANKPRWLVEKEEREDNAWREAGDYQFICEACGLKQTRRLRVVKTYRNGAICQKCMAHNSFG